MNNSTRNRIARIGLLFAIAAVPASVTGLAIADELNSDRAEVTAELRTRTKKLPREWRWEKKTVSFDHMYANR